MTRILVTLVACFQVAMLLGNPSKDLLDSVYRIREVTVTTSRLRHFSIGNKIQTIDSSLLSSYASSNLSQVLSASSQVQMNSYGLGLCNASMRGTGSSHAAVLWNGFNLQDLLNGGVDFSLIPVGFFDDIKVQYGGCGALYGSGAIGGAIHLNNALDFGKGLSASASTGYGSYDNFNEGLSAAYSDNYYSGFVKGFYNKAQNDFTFRNEAKHGSPLESQQNAQRQQVGLLVGNAFKTGSHGKFESFFWYQDNNKNIAPSMLTTTKDNQRDQFYRTNVSWKTWKEKSDFTIRSGFSDYCMTYDYDSKFQSLQSTTETEYNLTINQNQRLNVGLNYTCEKGESESLVSNAVRNRFTAFSSYRLAGNNEQWRAVLSFRDEMIDCELFSPTFSLGLEYAVTPMLTLKSVSSKNYRVPTFDDLYWTGLGNPDLKPESGFNQDLGFILSAKHYNSAFHYEFTAFSNIVSNWILWQPDSNGIWRPGNVSKVWARGMENDFSASFPIYPVQIKTTLSYSYTRSTKEKASDDAVVDETYYKQLIYVPEHKGLVSVSLAYKGYSLYYSQTYTGKRYTSADNASIVDAYTLGNLSASKSIKFHRQQLVISFQINNVWNTSYQVIAWYPMPLQNYQVNLQLNLQ